MPNYTPGCFGSAMCYRPKNNPCASCALAEDCSIQARASALIMREKFGIMADMRMQFQAGGLRKMNTRKEGSLPVKASQLIATLARQGIDLPRAIQNKVNPFNVGSSPAYMKEVVDSLLLGGFSRETLRDSLVKNKSWTSATADSHISFIIPALQHLKLIELDHDVFKLVGEFA